MTDSVTEDFIRKIDWQRARRNRRESEFNAATLSTRDRRDPPDSRQLALHLLINSDGDKWGDFSPLEYPEIHRFSIGEYLADTKSCLIVRHRGDVPVERAKRLFRQQQQCHVVVLDL